MKKLIIGAMLVTVISHPTLAQTEPDIRKYCRVNNIPVDLECHARLKSDHSLKTTLPNHNPATATPPIANRLNIGTNDSSGDLARSLSVSQGESDTETDNSNNKVTDTLNGGAGTVTNSRHVTGSDNQFSNIITTANGAINLTQNVTGNGNVIQNLVGAHTPVASFAQTLSITGGSTNTIINTADGAGIKTVGQTLTNSSNNMIAANLNGSGQQTANLAISNSTFVDYVITSTASTTYATVNLNNLTGTASSADIIRVVQSENAPGASATLTVDGGNFKLGTLTGTLPGTAAGSGAGVVVYQNSPNASLNARVTGTSGFTVIFRQ